MNIAVVGLGIIGGSFCKAIKKYTDHRVIGINRTKSTAEKALSEGAIDEIGTHESLGNADLIILSMYPQAVVDYVAKYGEYIKKGAVVTDVSGIKRAICPQMTELAEKFGFVFAGSHPMAGKETNGFDVSDADLYKNASYIIVPCKADDSVVNMPVLRPLIGMDKEEIVKISRNIDTFETSILPYEDCCTVFTPKHPKTRPTLESCLEAEKGLDVERLVEKAVSETQYSYIE